MYLYINTFDSLILTGGLIQFLDFAMIYIFYFRPPTLGAPPSDQCGAGRFATLTAASTAHPLCPLLVKRTRRTSSLSEYLPPTYKHPQAVGSVHGCTSPRQHSTKKQVY